MIVRRLRYIQRFKDRHGKVRCYLRRPGCKPIPLPSENDPKFDEAYRIAFAAAAPPTKAARFHNRSIEALARSYYDILLAANLGDDADTTAAIAGQLAGAVYGVSGIPDEWLAALAWRARLEDTAARLFAAGCPAQDVALPVRTP